jgi:hypothetical protein
VALPRTLTHLDAHIQHLPFHDLVQLPSQLNSITLDPPSVDMKLQKTEILGLFARFKSLTSLSASMSMDDETLSQLPDTITQLHIYGSIPHSYRWLLLGNAPTTALGLLASYDENEHQCLSSFATVLEEDYLRPKTLIHWPARMTSLILELRIAPLRVLWCLPLTLTSLKLTGIQEMHRPLQDQLHQLFSERSNVSVATPSALIFSPLSSQVWDYIWSLLAKDRLPHLSRLVINSVDATKLDASVLSSKLSTLELSGSALKNYSAFWSSLPVNLELLVCGKIGASLRSNEDLQHLPSCLTTFRLIGLDILRIASSFFQYLPRTLFDLRIECPRCSLLGEDVSKLPTGLGTLYIHSKDTRMEESIIESLPRKLKVLILVSNVQSDWPRSALKELPKELVVLFLRFRFDHLEDDQLLLLPPKLLNFAASRRNELLNLEYIQELRKRRPNFV